MPMIDLTHPIREGMPVYPGTEPPRIEEATTIEKEGFAEKLIRFYSHTGTHMDAPSHLLKNGKNLDQYSVSRFTGSAKVIRCAEGSSVITRHQVENALKKHQNYDFILFATGWSRYWEAPRYYESFPVLEPEAAEYLAGLNLKGIGVDCISVDPVGSMEMPIHHILLKHDLVIIENLCNLELLPGENLTFYGFPLNLEKADGSPIRAAASF